MAKVYTKKGDKGQTTMIGGSKIEKTHHRIEAYGNMDELNSFVGYLKDQINSSNPYTTPYSSIMEENVFFWKKFKTIFLLLSQ